MTEGSLNIKKYLLMVKKRKRIVVYMTAIFLLLSLAYITWIAWPALYSARCSIRVEKEISFGDFFDRALPGFGDSMETRELIITGYDLISEAAKKLSLVSRTTPEDDPKLVLAVEELKKKISVERKKDTNILNITVTDKDPAFARNAANTIAETYSSYCRKQQEKQLDEVLKYIKDQLQAANTKSQDSEEQFNRFSETNKLLSMEQQSGNLLLREKEIEDKIRDESDQDRLEKLEKDLKAVHESINTLMNKKFRYDNLKRTAESNRNMVSFLEKKKQETMMRKAEKPEGVEIVEAAALPSEPVNRSHISVLLITGILSGCLFGIFIALLSGIIDGSMNILEEIGKITDIKVLGIIPQTDISKIASALKGSKGKIKDKESAARYIGMASHYASESLVAESFRQLKSNIQLTEEGAQAKTIAITSCSRGEGKSMVSVNLAINFAQAGLRTLLVGSDLRNPALAKIFDVDSSPGLTDILLGSCPLDDAVKTVTDMVMGKISMEDVMISPGLDNLGIIPGGELQANSVDLIHSSKFKDFIDDAKKEYDVILLDSSPVLTTADAAILGRYADKLLIVFNSDAASKSMLKRAIVQLQHVGIKIKGIILNNISPELISGEQITDFSPEKTAEKEENMEQKKKPKDLASASASLSTDIPEPEDGVQVQKDRKKNSTFKILIPVIAIILIVCGLVWKKEELFPSKDIQPEAVVGNRHEIKSEPVKTEKKEALPEKEIAETENVSRPRVEPAVVENFEQLQEEQVNNVEALETVEKSETAAETVKFEYEEGRYPYSVHLASFKTQQRAENAVDIYAKQGISSYPVKVNLNEKGTWFRIYSGSYPDKESAVIYLEEKGIKDAGVKKTMYACYIGSYRNNVELQNKMKQLKEKQFFPYVVADGNNNAYALFTGAFLTNKGAIELSKELENAGIKNKVVMR